MKKLTALTLGFGLLLGPALFAQDSSTSTESKTTTKHKKKHKKDGTTQTTDQTTTDTQKK
jgi:hypothetical protein